MAEEDETAEHRIALRLAVYTACVLGLMYVAGRSVLAAPQNRLPTGQLVLRSSLLGGIVLMLVLRVAGPAIARLSARRRFATLDVIAAVGGMGAAVLLFAYL